MMAAGGTEGKEKAGSGHHPVLPSPGASIPAAAVTLRHGS